MRAGAMALLFAAFAASPAPAGELDSGVRGTVTLGPTSPVCMVDVPCSRPYATSVVIRNARTSQQVSVVQSDEQGRFRASLRAGRYSVRPKGGHPLPSCQAVSVRVREHHFTKVALECDTGIR